MKKLGNTIVIDVTPDPDGIVRWLRDVWKKGNRTYATNVMMAGWPSLDWDTAEKVLDDKLSLRDALGGK